MLKRNWNWRNNRLFCHIFVIGESSIGRGPCPPSPCLRLCSKWEKQKTCSQIFREVSGVFQRNFNCSKNSAVLKPRTGQFSRRLRDQGQGQGLEASRPRPRTSKSVLEAKMRAKVGSGPRVVILSGVYCICFFSLFFLLTETEATSIFWRRNVPVIILVDRSS